MRSILRTARSATALLSLLTVLGRAYEMAVSENDEQVCSGMYAGGPSSINVTFDGTSQGQLAVVIYEWSDVKYLGVPSQDESLPPTYICTTDAVRQSICTSSQLGHFITKVPENMTLADTSIWTSPVGFREIGIKKVAPSEGAAATGKEKDSTSDTTVSADGFWDNPEGPPTPPSDKYASPWKRGSLSALAKSRMREGRNKRVAGPLLHHGQRLDHRAEDSHVTTPTNGSIIWYDQPIHYHVFKTGYYCIGIVPVTILRQGESPTWNGQNHTHASFSGKVLFRNAFEGYLPAADYPKINFYMAVMLAYTAFAAGWALLCMRHRYDLLPIQNYISALFGLVVIEMLANWAYYRFLNAQGPGLSSKVFLFVVSILDAARNSLSFFLLLLVSLGLGVVREEIPEMTKCRILGVAHAIFGVLYAIGMDLVQLETVSALLLLVFVVPLAFTMTAFLLWIMYGLTGTIAELAARKQRYKLSLFTTLYRILMLAVVAIGVFFVWTSLSFSNRFEDDYAPSTWSKRWWLLDGSLVLLYMAVFVSIAFLWRPTGNNRRLAMSDELAQDEEDAEDYDLEAMEQRGEQAKREAMRGIDEMAGADPDRPGGIALPSEDVMFEIGDDGPSDDDDDGPQQSRGSGRRSGERRGLMPGKDRGD